MIPYTVQVHNTYSKPSEELGSLLKSFYVKLGFKGYSHFHIFPLKSNIIIDVNLYIYHKLGRWDRLGRTLVFCLNMHLYIKFIWSLLKVLY